MISVRSVVQLLAGPLVVKVRHSNRHQEVVMATPVIQLGVGIYSRADAARLLVVTPSRLRRWVGGYTYRYERGREHRTGSKPPVVRPALPVIDGKIALSFVELMELRVVKAFISRGVSLQQVRAAADLSIRLFEMQHPFASRRVFTDGKAIFSAVSAGESAPDVIQLSRDKHLQLIFGKIFDPFLDEIDFDPSTALAHKWWPLGRSFSVVLNPRIAFGAPTIEGTRVRTSALARMARVLPSREVAKVFEIAPRDVDAAIRFERELAAA